jgi:hypothetical protein
VGLAQQLFAGEAADLDEHGIAIQDASLEIGGRDQRLPLGKSEFLPTDRKIHAHEASLFLGSGVPVGIPLPEADASSPNRQPIVNVDFPQCKEK